VNIEGVDLMAAPGHKGLLGPMGTGFLYVDKNVKLQPIMQGGTGTYSKLMEPPVEFPESFEADKATLGFTTNKTKDGSKNNFDIEKLYKSYDFSRELITRIPHILPYYELSNEDKKRVILESKISVYLLKKKRYKEQFGIDLIDNDDYINALIEHLSKNDKSMRDLNNIIASSLLEAENAILRSNGKAKTLVLSGETVTNPTSFKLY
jgi:ATP-dependent protease Clp ATPase subunit